VSEKKRTRREDEWLPFPQVPAPIWATLGAVTHAFGAVLYQQFETRVIAGIKLEGAEEWVLRQVSPKATERKTIRGAVREMVEAGVLVQVEGGLRLLYATKTWEDHQRTVRRPSNDGGHKVEQPSTNGAGKVEQPSGNGQQTLFDKPAEPLDPTPPIDREIQEKDTQTGVRARVRDDQSDTIEDPVSYYAAVQLRFRKLHRDAGLGDPAMGGTQVGDFPERLANTAADLGEQWHELLSRTHAAWVAEKCPGTEVSSPYAAFVARFNRYAVEKAQDVTKGFCRASSADSHARSGDTGEDIFEETGS
jgi:hypothetical protein